MYSWYFLACTDCRPQWLLKQCTPLHSNLWLIKPLINSLLPLMRELLTTSLLSNTPESSWFILQSFGPHHWCPLSWSISRLGSLVYILIPINSSILQFCWFWFDIVLLGYLSQTSHYRLTWSWLNSSELCEFFNFKLPIIKD